MKEYEIWREGYDATCEHQSHDYYGKAKGNTFIDACLNFRYNESIFNYNGDAIIKKGDPINFDREKDGSLRLFGGLPCIWACRFFDNEKDAETHGHHSDINNFTSSRK